ncbi:MAG: RIP metalloprotease RseP [Rhodobacteraceae bacterium]|nr:RIP metalloprotease RseP [Paracoccaceae bacterium]
MDLSQLISQLGDFAFTLASFIVALSIIVAVHEFGHYIVGRWTGIQAEVFSLGFGKVLWSRVDSRGTKWQVSALPFGGYVKFLGDANAASFGGTAGGRNTMLGAPVWARALTVAAGPVFNFILSIIIFTVLMLEQGRPTDPIVVASVSEMPAAFASDLQPGDVFIAVNGLPMESENGTGLFPADLPLEPQLTYTVLRDGAELDITGPYLQIPLAGAINPNSAANDAGLLRGDIVLSVDGAPVFAFEHMVEKVMGSDGQVMVFEVWRDGDVQEFAIAPRRVDLPLAEGGFETRWLLGVSSGLFFEMQTEVPPFGDSVQAAIGQVWRIGKSSVTGLYYMLGGKISSCNLSGPVAIAEVAGSMAEQGLSDFFWLIGMLSTAIGLLNLFPIPILDGGHLVFHAYEAITGRPPSERSLRVLMGFGLTLILSLMAFGLLNDLFLCP